jgi:hypothetical protein
MPVIHIPQSSLRHNDMEDINNHLASDKPAFVLLYMEGCGPCGATRPEWNKMGKKYTNNDNIGVFDIEMRHMDKVNHPNLTSGVTGFPTMKYVKSNNCELYEDCDDIKKDRSYESFLEWVDKKEKKNTNHLSMKGGSRRKRRIKKRTKRIKRKTRRRKGVKKTRKKRASRRRLR